MSADQGGPAVTELGDEVGRLRKINAALIERAESYDESPGSDFGIFRSTVLLEDQIRSRTRALDLALRRLEDANSALRQSQAQLQAIFDVVPNPLAVALPDTGTFVGVSHSFAEFFGLAPEAMIGRGAGIDDLDVWPSEEDRARFTAALDSGGGRVSGFPLTVPLPSGSTMHLQLSGRLLDVDGRRLLLVEFHDVTAATHDVHRLRNLAEHDPLTGLPNRLLLLDRLACARVEAEASGGRVAVCYADMDKQQEFVLRTLEERDIRFVRLWFTDVLGLLKSVAVAPAELEGAFEEGIGFDGSAIEGFARVYESDMLAKPDPSARSRCCRGAASRPGTAGCSATSSCPTAAVVGRSAPRAQAALAKAADLGFTFYTHPEIEFFLLEPGPGTAVPSRSTRAATSTTARTTRRTTSAGRPSRCSRRWASRWSSATTRARPASRRSTCATPTRSPRPTTS
jgi:PAS domain S-box-containing protein